MREQTEGKNNVIFSNSRIFPQNCASLELRWVSSDSGKHSHHYFLSCCGPFISYFFWQLSFHLLPGLGYCHMTLSHSSGRVATAAAAKDVLLAITSSKPASFVRCSTRERDASPQFLCLIAVLVTEMHSASSTGNYETGRYHLLPSLLLVLLIWKALYQLLMCLVTTDVHLVTRIVLELVPFQSQVFSGYAANLLSGTAQLITLLFANDCSCTSSISAETPKSRSFMIRFFSKIMWRLCTPKCKTPF